MINNFNLELLTGGFSRIDSSWAMNVAHNDHCYKLYLPTKGKATLVMDGERYVIEPGYLYFLSGWHIDSQECEDFMDVYWMHFIPDSLQLHYLLSLSAPIHKWDALDIPWSLDTFKQLDLIFQPYHEEYKLKRRLKPEVPNDLTCRIQSILLFLISNILKGIDQQQAEEKIEATLRLQKATNFMDRHFLENPDLNSISKQVNMAPNYFHKKFRDAFGITPFNYMLNLRMQMAKELLSFSSDTIREIAFKTGYDNEFYFSRTFKKYTGLSPKAFRNRQPTA